MEKIKVFEAFSGIGTQRMALNRIGVEHEVVAISEIDKFAIKSYNKIHGETKNLGDISQIKEEDIPEHDLFTYSFPCQDISVAGKQTGLDRNSGTRSSLLWECNRIIEVARPKYLLLENVKNLVGKRHIDNFNNWLDHLTDLGYTNYWSVLNAKDFSVPQNRERVFVISILGEHTPFRFPEGKELEMNLGDLLEDSVENRYFLPQERVDSITPRVPSETSDIKQIFEYNRPNRKNSNRFRVYDKEGIAPALSTMQGGGLQPCVLLDEGIRQLTPRECWRLTGISDEDFKLAQSEVSNSQLYKQAGNAIVVSVLEEIFKSLLLNGGDSSE